MFTLFKKELASFFSSLIGYLTIVVFLALTGLMLWVFKSDFNILVSSLKMNIPFKNGKI